MQQRQLSRTRRTNAFLSSSALQGGGVRGGGCLICLGISGVDRESPTSPNLSAPKGGEELIKSTNDRCIRTSLLIEAVEALVEGAAEERIDLVAEFAGLGGGEMRV